MRKKGFTLIEAMMGLCLLGLIAVTVLPIINSAFVALDNHNTRMEMIYLGEMAMEKIKAFSADSDSQLFIYDKDVKEIVQLFRDNDSVEIILKDKDEKYSLKIFKNQKSDSLWMLSVYVYLNKEGSNMGYVEYKGYLPEK